MGLTCFGSIQAFLLVAILLLPTPLSAGDHPAEEPPPDFSAEQFIDSGGCVFVRIDGAWSPRRMRDGSNVCGFPPSLSAQEAPGQTRDALAQKLSAAVIAGLHKGELADPVPMWPAPAIEQELRDAPTIRQAIARRPTGPVSQAASQKLCDLLGGATTGQAGFGVSAKGFCNLSRLDQLTGEAGKTRSVAKDHAPTDVIARDEKKPRLPQRTTPKIGRPATEHHPKRQDLVKPWHRYVAIGTEGGPTATERTAARVRATGLPSGRIPDPTNRGVTQVVVGPFKDRESVIRAIRTLRSAGFSGLTPR